MLDLLEAIVFFVMVLTALMTVIVIPVVTYAGVYIVSKRLASGRWWWDVANGGAVPGTLRQLIAKNELDRNYAKALSFIYLAPPLLLIGVLMGVMRDKSDDAVLSFFFFSLAMFNVACVWIFFSVKRRRFENVMAAIGAADDLDRIRQEAQQRAKADLDRMKRSARQRATSEREGAARQANGDQNSNERGKHDHANGRGREETREKQEQSNRQEQDEQHRDQEQRQKNAKTLDQSAWHVVLGVSEDATAEDIRTAYIALLKQYHPDKVFNLGDDLKELATRKTAEINQAYSEAMAARES